MRVTDILFILIAVHLVICEEIDGESKENLCAGRSTDFDNCLKHGYHGEVCGDLGFEDITTVKEKDACPVLEKSLIGASCEYSCLKSTTDAETDEDKGGDESSGEGSVVKKIGHYKDAWKVFKAHQKELHPLYSVAGEDESFQVKMPCPWSQPPGASQHIFLGDEKMYVHLKPYDWKLCIGWKSGWGDGAPVVGNVLVNCALTGDVVSVPIRVDKSSCVDEYLDMKIVINESDPLLVEIGGKKVLEEEEVTECVEDFTKMYAVNDFDDDLFVKANWLS